MVPTNSTTYQIPRYTSGHRKSINWTCTSNCTSTGLRCALKLPCCLINLTGTTTVYSSWQLTISLVPHTHATIWISTWVKRISSTRWLQRAQNPSAHILLWRNFPRPMTSWTASHCRNSRRSCFWQTAHGTTVNSCAIPLAFNSIWLIPTFCPPRQPRSDLWMSSTNYRWCALIGSTPATQSKKSQSVRKIRQRRSKRSPRPNLPRQQPISQNRSPSWS